MAFAFFRRRQKLVLILMVLLMVAFLIPTAIENLGQGRSRRQVIGAAGGEKIRLGDLDRATVGIEILQEKLRLGQYVGQVHEAFPFEMFLRINAGPDLRLAWTLLLHEAKQMGIRVTNREVDAFLTSINLTGENLQREVRLMGGVTERDLRSAVADLLMVNQAFELSRVGVTPPLAEIRSLYRDLNERIALGTVSFDAADRVDKAPEPSEEDVFKQFQSHRGALPMGPNNKDPFGFGYRLPDRAQISWLLVEVDRVRDAVTVPEKMMLDYWRLHRGELKKKVPVPSSAPASTQSTQPTQPAEVEYRDVEIEKYSEAKSQIREILQAQEAEARVSEIIGLLRTLIGKYGESSDPYLQAYEAITAGADKLLAKPAGKPALTRGPLERVLASLERSAGVRIQFPYGEHEKLSIQPDVVVDIGPVGDGVTVGQALENIRAALKLPELSWRACQTLEGVVFAVKPVDLLPVSVGQTPLVSLEELSKQDVLGWASLGPDGRGTLAEVVSTAEVFPHPGRREIPPMVEAGKDFAQVMYVTGERSGRLLWRLDEALPEQAPEGLTPEIRKQVIADLKLKAAFELAKEEAKKIEAQITADKPLKDVAEQNKLKYDTTRPFSRKMNMQYFGGRITWSYVPGVGIDPGFLAEAFKLVPPMPEGWSDPGPAAVVDLPRRRQVMLIQRIEYEPPLEMLFELQGMSEMVGMLSRDRDMEALYSWLSFKNIAQRVGWKAES